MKKFETPILEVRSFGVEDVIAASAASDGSVLPPTDED